MFAVTPPRMRCKTSSQTPSSSRPRTKRCAKTFLRESWTPTENLRTARVRQASTLGDCIISRSLPFIFAIGGSDADLRVQVRERARFRHDAEDVRSFPDHMC